MEALHIFIHILPVVLSETRCKGCDEDPGRILNGRSYWALPSSRGRRAVFGICPGQSTEERSSSVSKWVMSIPCETLTSDTVLSRDSDPFQELCQNHRL